MTVYYDFIISILKNFGMCIKFFEVSLFIHLIGSCYSMCVEVRGQHSGIRLLLLPCRSLKLKSSFQDSEQALYLLSYRAGTAFYFVFNIFNIYEYCFYVNSTSLQLVLSVSYILILRPL